jgi:predicted LPLAT superfamily acyltransferase
MTEAAPRIQAWTRQPERGSASILRFGVWTARRLGRPLARLLLYPLVFYFCTSSPAASRASSDYLARALGRAPRFADRFTHFLTFARCLLDRVFLLNDESDSFEVEVHGEAMLRAIEAEGNGCLLFGAHLGSFEVARAIGRRRRQDLPISLLMYEENAQKILAALAAINPKLATEVIGLGHASSLIAVAERLRAGHFIGVLADRNPDGRDMRRVNFLGAPAFFPQGPFRVAMMLQRPVMLMVGLYRGGKRYEVHFELLAPAQTSRPADPAAWTEELMSRYAARIAHYCREAPYNWFNFYDFWA